MMTIKDYLCQAYCIDQRINSKIEQVATLRDLARKATSTLSDMPRSPNKNNRSMENIIVKIIDLENEINQDIDELVDLKSEVVAIIKNIKNPEHQTLLELRYLCFKTWEEVSIIMKYDISWVYRLHGRALKDAERIKQASKNHEKPLKATTKV